MITKLRVTVDELDEIRKYYDQIKVYRSTDGINGTYDELTNVDTRLRILENVDEYVYTDIDGAINYWYKVAYYNSDTANEDDLSEPHLSADTASDNILTVKELKEVYLTGVDLTDDEGNAYPARLFEWSILFAIDWAERELDIKLRPEQISWEKHDYYRLDYQQWMFIKLKHAPIIDDLDGADLTSLQSSLTRVQVVWPNASSSIIEFDQRWIQLREALGQMNIVPTTGTISDVLFTAGGAFLPLLAGGLDFVPNMIRVQYTAGFREGEVPYSIREVVGKKAAMAPLNTAGDLIVGAGIANQSISIDGLSQSIGTTSSATNSGYGARIGIYRDSLKKDIPMLRRHFRGIPLAVA
jgi:hypothetical protein